MPLKGPLPVGPNTTNTTSLTPFNGPPQDHTLDVEFLKNLGSGGSVIDFDYTRSRGHVSVKASVSLKLSLVCHILIMFRARYHTCPSNCRGT